MPFAATRAAEQIRDMQAAAILLAGALLVATASVLVTLDRLKYLFLAEGPKPNLAGIIASLTTSDWLLAGGTLVIGAAVPVWRRARRGLVLLCQQQPRLLLLPVGAALLWCGHAILGSGLIVTGDAGTHVARVNHLALAIQGGDSLFWDNWFFGGSTLLQFTGPVFHWIAAVLQLLVGDPTAAIKIAAFSIRLAAAWSMYALLRQYRCGRASACTATLFYAGSFFMTYMEVIRSSFPQMINFAAMPAILLFVERTFARPAAFGPATIGLSLSAIVFIGAHPPTALIFALFVAIYVVARLLSNRTDQAVIQALLVGAVLTGLGSAFFLIPFALERGMTADNFATSSLVMFVFPSLTTLKTLLIWGAYGTGGEYSTYAGYPMLVAAIVGGFVLVRRRYSGSSEDRIRWCLLFGLALLSLCVRGAYVRHVTFTFFFLCVSAGLGLKALQAAFPRQAKLPALIFFVTLLELGPLAVQPWTRSDQVFQQIAGAYLAEIARSQRVLEVSHDTDGLVQVSVDPNLSPIAYSRMQILMGPHKQDATKTHNAFAALLKTVEHDLRSERRLLPATRDMLALANVGWIVGTNNRAMGLPDDFGEAQTDPLLGRYWRLPEATPFVVSTRLVIEDRPAAFNVGPFWNFAFDRAMPDAIEAMRAVAHQHERMRPDIANRRAAAILVPTRPAGTDWADAEADEAPAIGLIAYEVTAGTVRLSVKAAGPGFIRLAHSFAASTRVSNNGASVTAIADPQSLIVLPLRQGRNDIVVTNAPSSLRFASLIVTGSLVVVLALGLGAGLIGGIVVKYHKAET